MDTYRIMWDDSLSIGNEYIDEQHKLLIELIKNIPESMTSYDPDILCGALEYAATHFSDEEAFMEEVGYPGLEEQKHLHKKLTRVLKNYERSYRTGKADLYSFKQFMFQWIQNHMMDEDRKIGGFLREQAREECAR